MREAAPRQGSRTEFPDTLFHFPHQVHTSHSLAAKSLQSCPTLCDPRGGSPPGSPVPGILQARTLEWVAISFSNAWKWKTKWSHSVMSDPQRPHGLQPTRLLHPWGFPGKSTGVGCHCLLHYTRLGGQFLITGIPFRLWIWSCNVKIPSWFLHQQIWVTFTKKSKLTFILA